MENINKIEEAGLEKVAGGMYDGSFVSSGSFASNSGTFLNLLVNWSVFTDNFGQRTLQVSVSATSYALVTRELPNGLQLTLNGMTYSARSLPINYMGTAMATNPLGSFTIPNFYGPASATVVFHFNGTLSNNPVGDIVATGMISG